MKDDVKAGSRIWESVCRRCGSCCYEKIDYQGTIYYTDTPCEFLDTETCLCRVYEDRENRRPGCVRLTREHLTKGFLPAHCPYVAGLEGYRAPVLPDEETE